MKKFQVTMATNGRTFTVKEGESVLTAALRQGVMLPYSCKNGTCGSCKGKVLKGEVHYPFHPPLALERRDHAERYALMCQAEPLEDLEIKVREIEAVRDIEVRLMPARVMEKNLLTDNVMQLWLKLPAAQRLQFLAGQYVDVLLKGGKRRAFSIASTPSHEDAIELHIRHVDGGDFTGHVFDTLQVRDIIRLEGPQGNFFVRNDRPERPLVLIGGGTGFAPLKSMVEHLFENGDKRDIHLYWGARYYADLYMNDLPGTWEAEHENFHYQRALSEQDGTDFTAYCGLVHEAVVKYQTNLPDCDVYIAGPPAMIDTARPALLEAGLTPDRLFYDSFEFGVDVPVRVLARPH
ncbi:CDP-6-deoxy-delta-3,4-glucoseen reductase [Elongatibacter sediminis]|uniref:CDP-6-deoxy-delta-3,4-glucoseen reductase n=1 Tax=Elongatibacter sediminis TaxID=3119006 RepID=A0AAW9RD26_9GAMM